MSRTRTAKYNEDVSVIMQKTYICWTCAESCDCWTCGDSYDACKLIVDGDDHAPTHCPYQPEIRAFWKEVSAE